MKTIIKRSGIGVYIAVFMLTAIMAIGFYRTESASAVLYGEVSYSGSGDIYGYTTDYVKYGGSQTTQHKVYNGWHISAYSSYYSHGVTWYECWDSDDGDYYGWIDGNYLYFYSSNSSSSQSVDSSHITPKSGQISGSGVYGYTSNYVLYGGSQETQHRVQNNWHVTAYNTAYSHGVTWYECWDTDDGDYYGWVDARYINFYSDSTQAPVVVTVTVPVQVTVTVPVMVTVTVPVTVTEPVIVTEPTTEATIVTTTTEVVTSFEAATVADDDSDDNSSESNNQIIVIIIAVAVIVIIAVSALLVAILSRKSRITEKPIESNYRIDNNNSQPEELVFCLGCGARRDNPNAMFCPKCGRPYSNNGYNQ